MNKAHRVWNADETGFSIRSEGSKVIGPAKTVYKRGVPHVSDGSIKQRFTVMYCASADGQLMPPFFVYPAPQPKAYEPLLDSPRGSKNVYTEKGWMNIHVWIILMNLQVIKDL